LTNNFPLLFKYIDKIKEILKQENPLLFQKTSQLELNDFLWITQWIQTLFTYKFNFALSIKLLDVIITFGIDVIVILIPIILEFFDKRLKAVESEEEYLSVLEDFYNLKGYDYSEFLMFVFKMLKDAKYKKYFNTK
jgi:hypothetical protein